ncbi:MAG: hypothetical protein WBD50_00855 [Candidatus Rhabdochlamydia sp.]
MRYFILTFTILSLVFNQKALTLTIYTPKASVETTTLQKWIGKGPLFFYDDIIALLDAIENDEIEECSPEDQEEIIQFLILLAREGVLPGDEEALEQDIQELLSQEDCSFSFSSPERSTLVLSAQTEVVLCRGWMKKQCKSAKRFIKKHKTGFIIGAVVVVAAAVVIFAVASPAVAASAAGASTAAVSKEKNKPKESFLPSTNIDASVDEAFEEHISSIKEFILEDTFPNIPIKENPSFTEKARDLGALLAHETLDGISEIGSCIPQFTQEIKEVGTRILPENTPSDDFLLTPMENYESLVAKGHQKIDQIFSTDHSECYNSEGKTEKMILSLVCVLLLAC